MKSIPMAPRSTSNIPRYINYAADLSQKTYMSLINVILRYKNDVYIVLLNILTIGTSNYEIDPKGIHLNF